MKRLFLLLLPLILIAAVSVTAPAQIKIDGTFFDWPAKAQLDVPPNQEEKTFAEGDDTDPPRGSSDPSYFADMDIEDVYAMDDADFVYIRVKMASIANVINISDDTSYHGGGSIAVCISVDPGANDTTGLTYGWWGSGYDYIITAFPEDSAMKARTGYQQQILENKQLGNSAWEWEAADTNRGALVAWNALNNEFEMAIPKSLLLHPKYLPGLATPDSIAIMVFAGENEAPWRNDYASNPGVAGYILNLKKPSKVTIDGLFFDWQASWQIDVPPNTPETTFADGDDTDPPRGSTDPTYYADMDLEDVSVADDEDFVFVRVKMASIANVMNILTDTSYHGGGSVAVCISVDPGPNDTTGLTYGWWGSGYDYIITAFPEDSYAMQHAGYQQFVLENKQLGNSAWEWEIYDSTRGAWVNWNALNNEMEMSIPKVQLLYPKHLQMTAPPESIAVMVFAGENEAPWRNDYASNPGVAGYVYKLSGTTGVRPDRNGIPAAFTLQQNYPNPFNPATTIKYLLPEAGVVTLRVFNVLGQEIATLLHGAQPAGEHVVRFNAASLSSGVYFYRLESAKFNDTKKMMVLK